ncbi:hypothetical protein BJY01DRAFT_236283 [Aspergillus pseudoustus]|uniref:Zn(2)-C6 fungal-type domain-containing protein n=1 Tax=Aspergillus pseudoustus TaxID=1810923 RepID=A0ABR4JNS1_9EURO
MPPLKPPKNTATAASAAQSPRSRRQNQSCDQCRKSKRACDASWPDLAGRGRPAPSPTSCSYCVRTRKRCTMEWARSKAQQSLLLKGNPRESLRDRDVILTRKAAQEEIDFGSGAGAWDLLGMDAVGDGMSWEPINLDLFDGDGVPAGLMFDGDSLQGEYVDVSDTTTPSQSLSELLADTSNASDISDQQVLDLLNQHSWPAAPLETCSSLQPATPKSPQRKHFQLASFTEASPVSLSPYSIDQRMITTSNHSLTSANLLQIYHDVLEHNLSCWLTETTCPYQRKTPAPDNSPAITELGASWSNRIYSRTIKLDRAVQATKLVRLTKAEDRAVSRALHLCIMAFATQWAQGSARQRERYPTRSHGLQSPATIAGGDGIAAEFDRLLQNNLWQKARRALQDVAEVESYRVACAEMIFGLTQRPWEADNPDECHFEPPSGGEENDREGQSFSKEEVMHQVREIIRKDGPPMFMESAARKMHALKYRFEAMERGMGREENAAHGNISLATEDRDTIGLLYWLSIMFDTVSSSMNERPVVVVDEECLHKVERAKKDPSPAQNRWNLDIFVPDGLSASHSPSPSPSQTHQQQQQQQPRTHWPCTYEDAAADVTRSAPIKVLLFRHIFYLQNALRKSAHASEIEDIIRSTTALYAYWNRTHGAFFDELVADYATVPQRIQGWFVCISAHWHLAALMFADLLDFVDENALGHDDAASARKAGQMARRIRLHSARQLADLARIASPEVHNAHLDLGLGVPQLPDFHHAVNEGTLLTEPWTIILIRAFTRACVIFLAEADEAASYAGAALGLSPADEFGECLDRAGDCIRGLWLLGKKSDMARSIAETLDGAAGRVRRGCVF